MMVMVKAKDNLERRNWSLVVFHYSIATCSYSLDPMGFFNWFSMLMHQHSGPHMHTFTHEMI